MSGHSKWAQIKHRKAGTDAKKGALFSKLARIISVAARDGGANPETNTKLRQAIEQARGAGLPKGNVERAVDRAASASDVQNVKAVEYEAYGPGGLAVLISGLTDNSNRTTNEVKRILADHGGRLAETGSVGWMFERRILATFPLASTSAEQLELLLIDAGATDTNVGENSVEAMIAPDDVSAFTEKMKSSGCMPSHTEFIAVPKTPVALATEEGARAKTLIELLEDHPDVNEVWTNIRE